MECSFFQKNVETSIETLLQINLTGNHPNLNAQNYRDEGYEKVEEVH
jgi:hypothetical protein